LRRYGSTATDSAGVAELVAIRAIGIGKTHSTSMFQEVNGAQGARRAVAPSGQRPVQLNRAGAPTPVNVYTAADLTPGDTFPGPALVDIGDTTAWVPDAMQATMDQNRTLVVENSIVENRS
jgi:N-methylhydantoinase A